MSEERLLAAVEKCPHGTALARHLRDGSLLGALPGLESRGLVRHESELYRLTRLGREELAWARVLSRLLVVDQSVV
jgi:hypothetical protein